MRPSSAPRDARGRTAILVLSLLLLPQGCGYFKNVRDDFLDCFIFGAGVVTPVAKTKEGSKGLGPIPPSFGIYVEATDFLHAGALYKASGDVEWDRRGLGVVADVRTKIGLGPVHYTDIRQYPIRTNDYKKRGNKFDGWRDHMQELEDPVFGRPAKRLIYDERVKDGKWFLHRGWQDWETFSVEIAIPEPFFFHSGINLRVGFDPSQVFDFLLSIVGLDLYQDNAFKLNGDVRYPSDPGEDDEATPERIRY